MSEIIESRMSVMSILSKPEADGESQRRKRRMARGRMRTVAMVRKKLMVERKMPDSLLPQPKMY